MFIAGMVLWQTEGTHALIGLWVLGLLVFIPGFYFTCGRLPGRRSTCRAHRCLARRSTSSAPSLPAPLVRQSALPIP